MSSLEPTGGITANFIIPSSPLDCDSDADVDGDDDDEGSVVGEVTFCGVLVVVLDCGELAELLSLRRYPCRSLEGLGRSFFEERCLNVADPASFPTLLSIVFGSTAPFGSTLSRLGGKGCVGAVAVPADWLRVPTEI